MIDICYRDTDGRKKRIYKVPRPNTRREAERVERLILRSLDSVVSRGKEVRDDVPTLKTFSEEFIRTYAMVRNKRSEVLAKEGNFKRYLLPALGHLRLDEIKVREVDHMVAGLLEDGLSAKSTNNALGTLKKLLNYAEEIEILFKAPHLRLLKVPPSEFDFLDFAEADRLLASTAEKEPEWFPFLLTALRTGLRWSELSELRWGDVDLVAKKLRVRRGFVLGKVETPKSRTSRRDVALSPQTVDALRSIRHLKSDLVFCYEDGKRLDYHRMNEVLWRLCRRAGLREIGWHVCRHTFASHLVMRGVPLKAVQELLGHSTIEMTMRYAHLAPVVKHDAVATLDTPVPQGQPSANSANTGV